MGSEEEPKTAKNFYHNNESLRGEEDTEAVSMTRERAKLRKSGAKLTSVASEKDMKHRLGIETKTELEKRGQPSRAISTGHGMRANKIHSKEMTMKLLVNNSSSNFAANGGAPPRQIVNHI